MVAASELRSFCVAMAVPDCDAPGAGVDWAPPAAPLAPPPGAAPVGLHDAVTAVVAADGVASTAVAIAGSSPGTGLIWIATNIGRGCSGVDVQRASAAVASASLFPAGVGAAALETTEEEAHGGADAEGPAAGAVISNPSTSSNCVAPVGTVDGPAPDGAVADVWTMAADVASVADQGGWGTADRSGSCSKASCRATASWAAAVRRVATGAGRWVSHWAVNSAGGNGDVSGTGVTAVPVARVPKIVPMAFDGGRVKRAIVVPRPLGETEGAAEEGTGVWGRDAFWTGEHGADEGGASGGRVAVGDACVPRDLLPAEQPPSRASSVCSPTSRAASPVAGAVGVAGAAGAEVGAVGQGWSVDGGRGSWTGQRMGRERGAGNAEERTAMPAGGAWSRSNASVSSSSSSSTCTRAPEAPATARYGVPLV